MTQPAPARSGTDRLRWLDVVRGIAALSVALHHLSNQLFVGVGASVRQWFDPGIFGVTAFFLVSGYIIPASLERRGDVRGFWIGRIFRLYPLCLLVFVAAALLPAHLNAVDLSVHQRPLLAAVANGTMLQDVLGIRSGLSVMWTLTYEMVFYYLVTMLFLVGAHRRSGGAALVLAIGALLLGPSAATWSLRNVTSAQHLIVGAAALVVLGLLCLLSGRRPAQLFGALLLSGLGLGLVVGNSRSTPWESLLILATMFSGTVIYRAEHGQLAKGVAWLCGSLVLLAGCAAGFLYDDTAAQARTWTASPTAWVSAFAAGWALFGAAFLLRRHRMPRFLGWLGVVSFSVYLLHRPLISAMVWLTERTGRPQGAAQLLWLVGFLAVLLALSAATYRLVELPGQRLGRAVVSRYRTAASPSTPAQTPAAGSGDEPADASGPRHARHARQPVR